MEVSLYRTAYSGPSDVLIMEVSLYRTAYSGPSGVLITEVSLFNYSNTCTVKDFQCPCMGFNCNEILYCVYLHVIMYSVLIILYMYMQLHVCMYTAVLGGRKGMGLLPL